MVCRAGGNYSGDDVANFRGTNWNGDVRFAPARLARPRNLKSLVELVAKATEANQPLHVRGSGWSFEDCAATDGVMVSLDSLTNRLHYVVDNNRQLLAPRWTAVGPSGPGGRLVHFEAGIRIASLCEQLDAAKLALPTLGGSNGQVLAGVISTSTHGSDWNQPPFPDLVRAVHLVFAGGQEVWIESASDPLTQSDRDAELRAVLPCPDTKIVRDDHLFNAVRVACGRFGVIYSVVLEVRTQFRVAQVVTRPNRAAVMQALRAGIGQPSVFTPVLRLVKNDPVPPTIPEASGVPYSFQVLFNALRPDDVWVTRRWETVDASLPDIPVPPGAGMKNIAIGVALALHNALALAAGTTAIAAATAAVGEIVGALIGLPGLGAVISGTVTATVATALAETTARLDAQIAQGNFNAGVVVCSAIDSLWKIPGMSQLVAEIEHLVLNGNLHPTARDLHYLVTSGTRADNDQKDFVSDSLEVVFDATSSNYLDFLDDVLTNSPRFHQAGYVSMRPSLSSKASLSMHNVGSNRAVSFEMASLKPLAGNFAWLQYCHAAAIRRNGRPHWGQFNKMQAHDTAMLYGDSLNRWREALLGLQWLTQQPDSNIFSNAFTRQRGLEPPLGHWPDAQHHLWFGDFTHVRHDQLLLYSAQDGTWWHGSKSGATTRWSMVGNTSGFGNLLDSKHPIWIGDFTGSGHAQVMFYYSGDGNWWLGDLSSGSLNWSLVSQSAGFGNLIDSQHSIWIGDFTGSGHAQVMFYFSGDGAWWLGNMSAGKLNWSLVNQSAGFGNLLDGKHPIRIGNFTGSGHAQVMFYYSGDGHWWLGDMSAGKLNWSLVSQSAGFGNLLDGKHPIWIGDFTGSGHTQVMFYFSGDGAWWLGDMSAGKLNWSLVSQSAGFGNLLDGKHPIWIGNFTGSGHAQVMFYSSGDGNWWLGDMSAGKLNWSLVSQSAGFGNLLDGQHPIWIGDFTGSGHAQVMFYYSGDGHWWLGDMSAGKLNWSLVSQSAGFGNLLDGKHPIWIANLSGSGHAEVLFFHSGDGAWWLGTMSQGTLKWSLEASTGR